MNTQVSLFSGLPRLHDSRSRDSATGIVTHAWSQHARTFPRRDIASWVQSWGFDMSNLSSRLVVDLDRPFAMVKVKCACASRGAQHSARIMYVRCLLPRLLVRRRVVRPLSSVVCGGLLFRNQKELVSQNTLCIVDLCPLLQPFCLYCQLIPKHKFPFYLR